MCPPEENAIHMAYAALRLGLTGGEYQAMAKAAYEAGDLLNIICESIMRC